MVRQHTGRKRDAARTKASILNAAVAEFAHRGPAGTRVDEIAARAGVNKSLIYQYFGSKQELYAEALNAVLEAVTERAEEFSRDFSTAQTANDMTLLIRRFLERHLDLMEAVPEWPRLLSWENLEGGRTLARLPLQHTYKVFLGRLHTIVDPLKAKGVLVEDFAVELAAQTVMALTHFFVIQKGTIQHLFQTDPNAKEAREAWLEHCTHMFMASFKFAEAPAPNTDD